MPSGKEKPLMQSGRSYSDSLPLSRTHSPHKLRLMVPRQMVSLPLSTGLLSSLSDWLLSMQKSGSSCSSRPTQPCNSLQRSRTTVLCCRCFSYRSFPLPLHDLLLLTHPVLGCSAHSATWFTGVCRASKHMMHSEQWAAVIFEGCIDGSDA